MYFCVDQSHIAIPFIEDNTKHATQRRHLRIRYTVHHLTPPRKRRYLHQQPLSSFQPPHPSQYHICQLEHNIGAVITAVKGKNMSTTMPKHIQYLYIPAIDHESFDLSLYFQASNELLVEETRRTNVLVHCMAGVSRSATLVIAYLMKSLSISLCEAFKMVKSKRKIVI